MVHCKTCREFSKLIEEGSNNFDKCFANKKHCDDYRTHIARYKN